MVQTVKKTTKLGPNNAPHTLQCTEKNNSDECSPNLFESFENDLSTSELYTGNNEMTTGLCMYQLRHV